MMKSKIIYEISIVQNIPIRMQRENKRNGTKYNFGTKISFIHLYIPDSIMLIKTYSFNDVGAMSDSERGQNVRSS